MMPNATRSQHTAAVLVALIALLLMGVLPAAAQDTPQTLTGWLVVLHGDPQPGKADGARYAVTLQSDAGDITAELLLSPDTARQLNGQQVQVQALQAASASGLSDSTIPVFSVQSIEPLSDVEAQALTGSQPWALILCRFPDISTGLNTPDSYQPLLSGSYPGLDHYWRTISYNNINLQGSTITNRWYTLPRTRSAYLPGGSANLTLLAQDCAAAANADVYFPAYVGLSFLFNAMLDCCAWGGGTVLSLDGGSRYYRAIWLPPWAQTYDVMAHEMGHGFGFPHSTGPADNPPLNLNIYVSEWDVMSSSGGTCYVWAPPYGCVPPATISYHLDLNGWIPANRKTTVWPGENRSVTLERTQQPLSNSSLLYARVPINGSATHFYSVEVRDQVGYDLNIPPYYDITPQKSVVIHEVDTVNHTGNGGPSYVIDSDPINTIGRPNGEGARWLVGETFTDSTNGITISVTGSGATTFNITINNSSTPSPLPNKPTNIRFTQVLPDRMALAWDDNAFNETAYRLYRWNGSDFVIYQTLPANSTSYTDTGLTCGDTHYYIITAFNALGSPGQQESPILDNAFYLANTTGPCTNSMGAPLRNYGSQPFTITWSPISWGVFYRLQIAYDSGFGQIALDTVVQAPVLQYSVIGLQPGRYYWRVLAVSGTGTTGDWSAADTFFLSS